MNSEVNCKIVFLFHTTLCNYFRFMFTNKKRGYTKLVIVGALVEGAEQ